MRVRPRLLRRFRRPRTSALPIGPEAAAPHVRLLSERLPIDEDWSFPQLIAQQAGARDDVMTEPEPEPEHDDDDHVVVELRPGLPGTAVETAPFDAEPVSTTDMLEASGARNLPARSIERLVFELAVRNEIVAQRVERIERRLDDLANEVFEAATQCDLIEVEARRARLAAEVTRLAVELRGEIDNGLTRLAREMADLVAQRGEVDAAPPPVIAPLVTLSDLADLDTLPGDVIGKPGPFAAASG
jgi:hypothetical protein